MRHPLQQHPLQSIVTGKPLGNHFRRLEEAPVTHSFQPFSPYSLEFTEN